MAVRILIADDHARVRVEIKQLILKSGYDWEVCCEASDGPATIEQAAQGQPDLLIIDLIMPGCDGISAGRKIREFLPNSPMMLFTLLESEYLEREAKKAGFFAMVHKASPSLVLISAIRDALASRRLPSGHAASRESRGPSGL
ncbi:MAG TPA: response regulator transcription factor [Candidatus Acidoferrales bacterium]|nr:response regulator transcription factor [Candidatus Acidoferrales bacterium]